MIDESPMRCEKPGWKAVIIPDGRRGLWVRVTEGYVELCAGREGDDAYVKLLPGDEIALKSQFDELVHVAECLLWSHELYIAKIEEDEDEEKDKELKSILVDCLFHLDQHNREYHHLTPDSLLDNIRNMIDDIDRKNGECHGEENDED